MRLTPANQPCTSMKFIVDPVSGLFGRGGELRS